MEEISKQREFALTIAERIVPNHRTAMRLWLGELLNLRELKLSKLEKARRSLSATFKLKLIWPVLRTISAEIKKHGWDNRTKHSRVLLSASAVGMTVFGGKAAGVAALGGAIGLPLWIVLGAGSVFASTLYDDLIAKERNYSPSEPKVVNAVKDEDGVHRI